MLYEMKSTEPHIIVIAICKWHIPFSIVAIGKAKSHRYFPHLNPLMIRDPGGPSDCARTRLSRLPFPEPCLPSSTRQSNLVINHPDSESASRSKVFLAVGLQSRVVLRSVT